MRLVIFQERWFTFSYSTRLLVSVSKHLSTKIGARRRASKKVCLSYQCTIIAWYNMVLPWDKLLPFTQPDIGNLNYKQEKIISQLYPLAWNNRNNYSDWLCMREVLDNKRHKSRRIEAEAQRQLLAQRNHQPPPDQSRNWGNKMEHISSFSLEQFHKVLRSTSSQSDLVDLGPLTRRKRNTVKG